MNRRILITGATGGIGEAVSQCLATNGFDLALQYNSNADKAETLKQRLREQSVNVTTMAFDVTNRQQVKESLMNDMDNNGVYYGVVCNAGIIRDQAFPAMSGQEWDDVLSTNLDSFYNVLNPLIMPMVRAKQGGRIITMASVSGLMGNRGQTNYSASKGGLIAASKSLAIELAKRNITVNCVAPGIIETDMTEHLDDKMLKQIVPLRRAGKTEEVASLVAYLMSDAAAYITRQVISVNGGMV